MRYRVEVDHRAAKQIESLQPTVRERIIEQLEHLQADPRLEGCSKLKGQREPAWRIRVGDYRILYRIHDDLRLVRVYGALRRDEAYRA
ncbi:MAG: type II toxin-antitoxin system RelE/ParE family toxin [Armatimonadota bacterium]|nr:type II toxin-antitoxin system RelE/ParE family toxin [Armatimonadota bacterium]